MYQMSPTRDGGLRFWSVYGQCWNVVRYQCEVSEREYAAMPAADRARVDALPSDEDDLTIEPGTDEDAEAAERTFAWEEDRAEHRAADRRDARGAW